MLISGGVCVTAGLFVMRHRQAVASQSLAALLFFSAIWAIFYGLELLAHDVNTKQSLGNIKYIGVAFVPVCWLVFTLRSTGRGHLINRRTLLYLALEPALVLILLALPATQELVRHYPDPPLERFPIVLVGPLFWPNAIYLNIVAFAATALFLVTLSRHTPQYRRQRSWLAFAYLLPWAPNVAHNLSVGPFALIDLTPVALSISGPIMVWGFFRSRLLDLAPIARSHVVENMPDGVLVLDPHMRIVDHNPASPALLNLGSGDLIGLHVSQILPISDVLDGSTLSGIHRISITQSPTESTDSEATMPARVLEIEVTALEGLPTLVDRSAGYLIVLRDATERLANEERLQLLAHHDSLTGLANRKLFTERLDHALAYGRRNNNAFALLFIDLDRFKTVNDMLGHDIGDLLLQQVAKRLQSCLREEDTLARIGGDEFIVLIARTNNDGDAGVIASKLLASIEAPFVVDGHHLRVTASIGVSRYPANGTNAHQLMTRADSAMYLAKAEGKNRVHIADDSVGPMRDDARFEAQLRRALDEEELTLEFLPCIAVSNNALVRPTILSLEALVRWHNPERGVIPPDVFIPMAEEAGFMPALGLWILERSCEHAARWRDECGIHVNISVNVSAAQLGHHLLARHAGEAMMRAGLSSGQLVLEISERALIVEASPVIAELEALRAAGVQLSLDDFGTGNTSLSRLKRLDFNQLKIDPEFIRDLSTNSDHEMMVSAMVNLGHSLGMEVIAEGVENEDELQALGLIGCDGVQGYLFGQPLSIDDATDWLIVHSLG